jgi:hypothetical protein
MKNHDSSESFTVQIIILLRVLLRGTLFFLEPLLRVSLRVGHYSYERLAEQAIILLKASLRTAQATILLRASLRRPPFF